MNGHLFKVSDKILFCIYKDKKSSKDITDWPRGLSVGCEYCGGRLDLCFLSPGKIAFCLIKPGLLVFSMKILLSSFCNTKSHK